VKKQIVRVGLDLDGVILYNPVRGARSFAKILKNLFLKSEETDFYIPKTKLYKTSIFASLGYEDVIKLIKNRKIEAYIISGRYKFLKNDFNEWLEKLNVKKYFKDCLLNENDEQPYIFKQRMLNKLKINIYIEDNWDIIKQLKKSCKNVKLFWITNIIDKKIEYQYKFKNLRKAVQYLQKRIL